MCLKDILPLLIFPFEKFPCTSPYDFQGMAAEYLMGEGNFKVILCERGIRTFETHTRNTLDIAAVPVLKELSHLPVIVDPSHGTGIRNLVSPMAKAAVAAGVDGLMIEVHPRAQHVSIGCDADHRFKDI